MDHLLIVGSKALVLLIPIVFEIIDSNAFLAGMLVPPQLPEQLGGLAREHRAKDKFNAATV